MSAKPSMSKPNMSAATESAARGGSAHPLRAISFGDPAVTVERHDDGTIYLRPKAQLRRLSGSHHRSPASLGRRSARSRSSWRSATPAAAGGKSATRNCWISAVTSPRRCLARGLSAEKPIVILSGNSIDHALLAFGALYAGIPFCPVSPAYSLVSRDYGKLGFLIKLLTPGLVFADDADKVRRRAGGQCFRGHRNRGQPRRGPRPRRDDARRSHGHAGASAP